MNTTKPDIDMTSPFKDFHVGPALSEDTLHRARLTIAAHAPKEEARTFLAMLGLGVAS